MPPQLRDGVSRAVTTPPVGIAHPFWGAQTHTRAEGVDLELWTTALVVSDGTTIAAIVDSDLPNVPDSLSAEVRQRVSGLTGIPPAEMLIEAASDLLEAVI
jgi:hypothetical protein